MAITVVYTLKQKGGQMYSFMQQQPGLNKEALPACSTAMWCIIFIRRRHCQLLSYPTPSIRNHPTKGTCASYFRLGNDMTGPCSISREEHQRLSVQIHAIYHCLSDCMIRQTCFASVVYTSTTVWDTLYSTRSI